MVWIAIYYFRRFVHYDFDLNRPIFINYVM